MSAVGLLWDGADSSAAAQSDAGASSNVVVDYGALNALPGSDFARSLGALAPGVPRNVPTTLQPGAQPGAPSNLQQADSRVAPPNPPGEPVAMPSEVSIPEPVPPPPAAGVNADLPIAAPPVDPAAGVKTTPASTVAETPKPEAPAAPPVAAAEEVSEAQVSQEPMAETPSAAVSGGEVAQASTSDAPSDTPQPVTAPAAGEAAGVAPGEQPEEQPGDEAATEPVPDPDNSRPAPPIPEGGIRIIYPADLNDVPVEANAALDDLAAKMLADESMRIEIKCYASGTGETESKARRKSLARCISIRQYLFKKDVRTTRMDVRALGLKSEGQPADRVDIVPANS